MPILKAKVKKMNKVLALKWTPIGVKFSDNSLTANQLSSKVNICEAFNIVRHENVVITITKENCVCPGGRHFTGLEIFPIENLAPNLTTEKQSI